MASAEDLKDKISSARLTVAIVVLFCLLAGHLSFAREKIFVAGGGGEWTSRLVEALGVLRPGIIPWLPGYSRNWSSPMREA